MGKRPRKGMDVERTMSGRDPGGRASEQQSPEVDVMVPGRLVRRRRRSNRSQRYRRATTLSIVSYYSLQYNHSKYATVSL